MVGPVSTTPLPLPVTWVLYTYLFHWEKPFIYIRRVGVYLFISKLHCGVNKGPARSWDDIWSHHRPVREALQAPQSRQSLSPLTWPFAMSQGPLGADTWWLWTWKNFLKNVPWFPLSCCSPAENKCQELLAHSCVTRIHKRAVCLLSTHFHGFCRSCSTAHAHQPCISWPRSLVSQVNWDMSHCVQIPGDLEKPSTIPVSALVYIPPSKQLCAYLHWTLLCTN